MRQQRSSIQGSRLFTGQQIALLPDLNMAVVSADPLFSKHGPAAWRQEKADLGLVGDFNMALSGGVEHQEE